MWETMGSKQASARGGEEGGGKEGGIGRLML